MQISYNVTVFDFWFNCLKLPEEIGDSDTEDEIVDQPPSAAAQSDAKPPASGEHDAKASAWWCKMFEKWQGVLQSLRGESLSYNVFKANATLCFDMHLNMCFIFWHTNFLNALLPSPSPRDSLFILFFHFSWGVSLVRGLLLARQALLNFHFLWIGFWHLLGIRYQLVHYWWWCMVFIHYSMHPTEIPNPRYCWFVEYYVELVNGGIKSDCSVCNEFDRRMIR